MQWVIDDLYHPTPYSIIYTLVGVIFFLVSLRFLFSGLSGKQKEPRSQTIRSNNEFGETEITLDTLESLATRAAKKVRGIRDLKTRVRPFEGGAVIKIRTYVDGDVPIPPLVEQVQHNVKEQVELISGVHIHEVTVLVSDVYKGNAPRGRRVE